LAYNDGMNDCVFCSIANGDPSKLIWQNDLAAAFKSINPEAKVHVLVVPKQHIKNIDALDDEALAGKLVMAVREVIRTLGLVEANKVMVQGIEIPHLHFHIMSDRRYKG
jgi:histidine triad (HIT) family protein